MPSLLSALALGSELLPDPVEVPPASLDLWAQCPFCKDTRKYTDRTERIAQVVLERINVKCQKCQQVVVLVPVPEPPPYAGG